MASLSLTPNTPAAPVGLAVGSGVKSATLLWAKQDDAVLYEVWQNVANTTAGATKIATVATNSYAPAGLSGTFYFWVKAVNIFNVASPFSAGVQFTPVYITSADTTNTDVVSAGVSVGASSSSGNIPAYDTWTSAGYASFAAIDDSLVTISIALLMDISSVVGTGLEVLVRSRLYDVTAGADVPAGTKTFLVYSNALAQAYGPLNSIQNFNENFVGGFRGLLTPGHEYRLYAEGMKRQVFGGTGTATVKLSSALTGSGSASI